MRVAPADAWVLHGVVEGAAGVVEDLAYVDAVGDQSSRAASMSYTAKTKWSPNRLGGCDPLPKMIEASELGGVNCMTRKSSPAT